MAEVEMFNAIFGVWGPEGFWFANCVLAIIVMALIMGILYVISTSFNLMGLKRYAVSEFMQLAATAVMVIFLVSIISIGQTFISGQVTCKGEVYSTADATDEIQRPDIIIGASICRTEEKLVYFNSLYEKIREEVNAPPDKMETRYYFMITVFGITIYQGSWEESTHRFVEARHSIAAKIISMMLSLNSQLFVLKYIQASMLTVFLPLGIILRVLHFTRGIGGFFIALAISMYFVYPAMLFMMDATNAPLPPKLPPVVMNRADLCNLPVFSGFSLGSASVPGQGSRSAAAISVSSSDLASFVSQVFVRLFYDNMVALAIALTAMRYGSSLLGSESGVFLQMMGRWI